MEDNGERGRCNDQGGTGAARSGLRHQQRATNLARLLVQVEFNILKINDVHMKKQLGLALGLINRRIRASAEQSPGGESTRMALQHETHPQHVRLDGHV